MALDGKVAIVTGATSGIGLETAKALAGEAGEVLGQGQGAGAHASRPSQQYSSNGRLCVHACGRRPPLDSAAVPPALGRLRQRPGLGATVVLGVRNVSAGEDVVKQIQQAHPGAKVSVGPPLDLLSQDSVRQFAAAMNKQLSHLDILINNAGVSFMARTITPDGVGGIAQVSQLGAAAAWGAWRRVSPSLIDRVMVIGPRNIPAARPQTNHLGPYTLTRLLEKKLVESKARVVTLGSVTHRTTIMKDARAFLTDWRSGYYQHSKLANVLFGYELQRRLGNFGVTSCLADPGGVRSSIWEKSPMFKKGFARCVLLSLAAGRSGVRWRGSTGPWPCMPSWHAANETRGVLMQCMHQSFADPLRLHAACAHAHSWTPAAKH